MYSVVLVTAMVATSASPAWHRCHGAASCGCYSGYAGYAGYSGYAGYAGCGCHSFGHVQGYGAAGGCYGYHGGCYGAFGIVHAADPHHHAFYGCYGGYACYGVPVPGTPVVRPNVDPFPPINPKKKPEGKEPEEIAPPKEKKKEKQLEESVRATIRIDVPVGGKLYVDDQHIATKAGVQTFETPALAAGKSYFYDIRIEVAEQGVIRREERRIVIHPGQDALVSFPNLRPATNTAQGR